MRKGPVHTPSHQTHVLSCTPFAYMAVGAEQRPELGGQLLYVVEVPRLRELRPRHDARVLFQPTKRLSLQPLKAVVLATASGGY